MYFVNILQGGLRCLVVTVTKSSTEQAMVAVHKFQQHGDLKYVYSRGSVMALGRHIQEIS